MITLVGVGHVFDLRRQLRDVILQRRPRVVGLELDSTRWTALQARERRGGGVPVVYRLLGFFQERIADKYGGKVGEEMLAAADAAKEVGADLAFLDRDALQAFREMWGGMGFRERSRFLVSLFAGMFVSKKRVETELRKFEDQPVEYMEEVADEFPQVKRVLVDGRNEHIARALREVHSARGAVVAVVGDAHIEGLSAALSDLPLEVIRLRQLRDGAIPAPPAAPAGASVTFSYDARAPPEA